MKELSGRAIWRELQVDKCKHEFTTMAKVFRRKLFVCRKRTRGSYTMMSHGRHLRLNGPAVGFLNTADRALEHACLEYRYHYVVAMSKRPGSVDTSPATSRRHHGFASALPAITMVAH